MRMPLKFDIKKWDETKTMKENEKIQGVKHLNPHIVNYNLKYRRLNRKLGPNRWDIERQEHLKGLGAHRETLIEDNGDYF